MESDPTWFRLRLRELKMTQENLANSLRVDRTVVSTLIRRKRNLRFDQAILLAGLLQISLDELAYRLGLIDALTPPTLPKSKTPEPLPAGLMTNHQPERRIKEIVAKFTQRPGPESYSGRKWTCKLPSGAQDQPVLLVGSKQKHVEAKSKQRQVEAKLESREEVITLIGRPLDLKPMCSAAREPSVRGG